MKSLAIGRSHTLGDYLYDAIYVAGIGGGLIALFFLAFDIMVHGEAFLTPTLMGKMVGSSRVDLQACKLEYSIVSPK